MGSKLTKAQYKALAAVAESGRCRAWGSGRATKAQGASLWALERRGLVTWDRDENGVYFEITDAGRAALSGSDKQ